MEERREEEEGRERVCKEDAKEIGEERGDRRIKERMRGRREEEEGIEDWG